MPPYPFLDDRSAALTQAVLKLSTNVGSTDGIEYAIFPTASGYGSHVLVRAQTPDRNLYYTAKSIRVGTITIPRGFQLRNRDLEGRWKSIPEPIDGVYLDPDADGRGNPGLPWTQMMDHGKWNVLEWYLGNKELKKRMGQRVEGLYVRELDIGRMFAHYPPRKFDEVSKVLPWNIFKIAERIRPEHINTEQKRTWLIRKVVGYAAITYDTWTKQITKIAVLQGLGILPQNLHPGILALAEREDIENFPAILLALTACRHDLLTGDLELSEIWDIIGVYPTRSGDGTKPAE